MILLTGWPANVKFYDMSGTPTLIACEMCGRPATDRHHCLYHRRKGDTWRNHPYNIEWLCRECHNKANSYEHRCEFWKRQLKRYGQAFRDWHDTIPAKVRSKFE